MDAFRSWVEEAGRAFNQAPRAYDPLLLWAAAGVVALALVASLWRASRRRRQLVLRVEALESDVRALVMDRERELLRQVRSQPKA